MNRTIAASASGQPRRRSCFLAAGWVLAWNLGTLTLVALAAMGEPTSFGSRVVANEVLQSVDLEVIGSSFTTGEGGGRTSLIYSVALGDPRPAERRAYAWFHQFGVYALDGDLWTRVRPESNEEWLRTSFRRPVTLVDMDTFAVRPDAFKVEIRGGVALLPRPFGDLDETELASIDYIVSYALGGTRAALKVGVTRDDADIMLRRLRASAEPRS